MSFRNSFVDAFKNLRRQIFMSAASVMVMALAIFSASALSVLLWGMGGVLDFLETRAQMTIFFVDEAAEEQILSFKGVLESSPEIVEARYISKQEALDIYLNQHRDEPVLLESIAADIFPASLDIRARNIESLTQLADFLGGQSEVIAYSESSSGVLGLSSSFLDQLGEKKILIEELVFYQDAASRLAYWVQLVRTVGLTLVGFLGVVSLLIVLVTVGLSIRNGRDQIAVMKLVGATDWYVRTPYLLQGWLVGMVGGLVSLLLLTALAPLIRNMGGTFLTGIPFPQVSYLLLGGFALAQLLGGGIVGVVGSWVAVRRYLRV